MALQLIQGTSIEDLFNKLTDFDSKNGAYRMSNIVQELGKFSCIVTTADAPVTFAGANTGDSECLHVWVMGGSDAPGLPVVMQS